MVCTAKVAASVFFSTSNSQMVELAVRYTYVVQTRIATRGALKQQKICISLNRESECTGCRTVED